MQQKAQRYDEWKRHETVRLVKDYLICIDELATLKQLYLKKLSLFENLARDVEEQEEEDLRHNVPAHNEKGESAKLRVQRAVELLRRDADDAERLLADLLQALNAVSRRNIGIMPN